MMAGISEERKEAMWQSAQQRAVSAPVFVWGEGVYTSIKQVDVMLMQ